ncbi:MAG TPA: hypothetical protein VJA21_14445 [Verrucomicrobiae bacterium]
MNDSESLRFACPLCGQHIECTAAWAGVELDCPACAQRIRAPLPAIAVMPQAAPVSAASLALTESFGPGRTQTGPRGFHGQTGGVGNEPLTARTTLSCRQEHAEELRQTHLSREAHVKGFGLLYIVAGCIFGISGCSVAFDPERSRRYEYVPFYALALALLFLSTGMGLRKLRPWSRIVSGVISGFGLLVFPFGTLINGLVLYMLFSQKGAMVFSERYQRAIAVTPNLKYRTPIILWILLGIVLLLFIVAVFYAGYSGFRRR